MSADALTASDLGLLLYLMDMLLSQPSMFGSDKSFNDAVALSEKIRCLAFGPERCSFTRDRLIEVISRLEAYPATLESGRVVIMAESMADAIIEGLEDGR